MPKEYRTIQEVAGPLMLVRGVEDVAFDELGEIELADGETRRCRVLEIDGSNALVQLFESSTGINLSNSCVECILRNFLRTVRIRNMSHGIELNLVEILSVEHSEKFFLVGAHLRSPLFCLWLVGIPALV